jgi:shikimate kinase
MRLSLVGMSGSGKSYWSKKLSKSGFRRFCCDDMIADRLALDLGKKHGCIVTVGKWMGFPFEPQYKEREAKYLACETEVMSQILGELAKAEDHAGEKVVVDTTGSVIYTSEAILARLRDCTIVVHLSTPLEIQKVKLDSYIGKPTGLLARFVYEKT